VPVEPAAVPPAVPVTLADWSARVVWHLQQADALLTLNPPDSVTSSGRASAHARTADAISHAIDAKLIH
jgi:arginine decarboxylase-like protein